MWPDTLRVPRDNQVLARRSGSGDKASPTGQVWPDRVHVTARGDRSVWGAAPRVRVVVVVGPTAAIGSGTVGSGRTNSQSGCAVCIRTVPVAPVPTAIAVATVPASVAAGDGASVSVKASTIATHPGAMEPPTAMEAATTETTASEAARICSHTADHQGKHGRNYKSLHDEGLLFE